MNNIDVTRMFTDNWQLVLAISSAVIYAAGYLRAMLFIRTLGTKTTPTEIYAPSSLFVSGISTILASISLPVLFLAASTLTGRWDYSLISLPGGLIYLAVITLTLLGLPVAARINLAGFRLLPESSILSEKQYIWLRVVSALVLANLLYMPFSSHVVDGPAAYRVAYCISLVLWVGLLISQQYFIGLDIKVGISPGNFSQDPAMRGALITTNRICPLGQEQPEFGEGVFSTYGLLLNRRAGAYYFYPGVGAQEQVNIVGFDDFEIVIVPESRVIVFVHIPGVWL